jgi:hypothetical protein
MQKIFKGYDKIGEIYHMSMEKFVNENEYGNFFIKDFTFSFWTGIYLKD